MSRVSHRDSRSSGSSGFIGGLSFIEALALLFIALKLTGFLPTWTWLWVLSPLWITFSIALVIAIIVVAVDEVNDHLKAEGTDD